MSHATLSEQDDIISVPEGSIQDSNVGFYSKLSGHLPWNWGNLWFYSCPWLAVQDKFVCAVEQSSFVLWILIKILMLLASYICNVLDTLTYFCCHWHFYEKFVSGRQWILIFGAHIANLAKYFFFKSIPCHFRCEEAINGCPPGKERIYSSPCQLSLTGYCGCLREHESKNILPVL